MTRKRNRGIETLECVGGPLDGQRINFGAGANLIVEAANGSYWRATRAEVPLISPNCSGQDNPLWGLVHIALWAEGRRFCFPNRAAL